MSAMRIVVHSVAIVFLALGISLFSPLQSTSASTINQAFNRSGKLQETGVDPIPSLINQISIDNLMSVANTLVTAYGPRRSDTYSSFIDDQCTMGSLNYPKSTIEMSSDYARSLFKSMGYPDSAITMEEVPNGVGHNVYVTKTGSVYPNTYIEIGAHMDSTGTTPGGNDNGSGSTAVIELARVFKDYPNRFSIRFALWVSEEYSAERGAFFGSTYHVQQALARGEAIKAGLNLDQIGYPDPTDPTGLMNEISYIDDESKRIADMYDEVRTEYGIVIGFRENKGFTSSDEFAYWNQGQTAVSNEGGWLTYRPYYHDCGDTVSNINFTNVLRAAQENVAVTIWLDQETNGSTSTPTVVGPTSTPTQTSTPVPTTTGTITMGETNILNQDDYGNGSLFLAQQTNLSQGGIIQSLSFYVTSAAGRLQLGVYSDNNGKPQDLIAQTGEFTPVVGWNTRDVQTPTQLAEGTYWLVYLPESNSLHFRVTASGTTLYGYPYTTLTSVAPANLNTCQCHFSFYASLLYPSPSATFTPTLTQTPNP
jgi:hypothetical protein